MTQEEPTDERGHRQGTGGRRDGVWLVAFAADDALLVSGHSSGFVKYWNVEAGKLVASVRAHQETVASVAVDPTGEYVVSSSFDNSVKLWKFPPIVSDGQSEK